MTANDIYYVDGKFVPASEASVPVHDLHILRGFGIFDFTRTYHHKPFRLDVHVQRLFDSAVGIELEMPWSKQEVTDIVLETVAKNPHHTESFVRIVVTGGCTMDSLTAIDRARMVVMVTPAGSYPETFYTEGVKVITVEAPRYLPGVKSLAYISAVRETRRARAQGAKDAVYVEGGYVREGTTTNIFAFIGDTLVTPGEQVLLGVTRRTVIELAQDVPYHLEIREMTLDEFYHADEAFLTSSTSEVMPITRVNAMTIGNGKPGERTLTLLDAFRAYAWET